MGSSFLLEDHKNEYMLQRKKPCFSARFFLFVRKTLFINSPVTHPGSPGKNLDFEKFAKRKK
jgi:hypothetical protein